MNASVATPVNELAYRRTFETIRRDQADGLVFTADNESYSLRLLLVELVKEIGLPAIFVLREQAAAGGLFECKLGGISAGLPPRRISALCPAKA